MNSLYEKLNDQILDITNRYQNLKIYKKKVNTPYYINMLGIFLNKLLKDSGLTKEQIKKVHEMYKNRQIPFGWYRGKGTPKQIEKAVIEISEKVDLSLNTATNEGISEFMKLYGLGIDCSGFIYNTLSYAFNKVGKLEEFNSSLNWADPEKISVNYAGAFVFAKNASKRMGVNNLQPLDLLLLNKNKEYFHIAILVNHKGRLRLAQSNINTIPTGVTVSDFKVEKNMPVFGFKQTVGNNWDEYFKNGQMEFRRLKVLL